MKDEETVRPSFPTDDLPVQRPTTYELLVRQSKKMGSVATRAFHNIRTVLHHEISLPSAEQFIGNFPTRSSSAHASNTSNTSESTAKADKRSKELEQAAELKQVVKKSHEVIASARTVFPITLFPDSLVVDRTKVSIIKRDFFWSSNVISFQIEDILNVSSSIGPLFGSLTIASRVMSTIDHFNINYLWRGDAVFMKHLIQGYIIAKNNKLETDKLTKKELIDTLCELGIDYDH